VTVLCSSTTLVLYVRVLNRLCGTIIPVGFFEKKPLRVGEGYFGCALYVTRPISLAMAFAPIAAFPTPPAEAAEFLVRCT